MVYPCLPDVFAGYICESVYFSDPGNRICTGMVFSGISFGYRVRIYLLFAQIKAKSKRKAIGSVQMDDVLGFAPRGDRSVYKYENDKNLAYKNLTSGDPEAKVYELIAKGEKGLVRYEFEPDDEMLDEVMVKYPRSVVR